jgi:hypothetical protein
MIWHANRVEFMPIQGFTSLKNIQNDLDMVWHANPVERMPIEVSPI